MTEYTENYGKTICDELRKKVLERKINIHGNETVNFSFNNPLDKLLSLVDEYFSQNTVNEYPIGFYIQYTTNCYDGIYSNGIGGRTSTLITNFGNIYRFYWDTTLPIGETYKEIFKNFGSYNRIVLNAYLEVVKINNTKLYNNEIDVIKSSSFFKETKTTSGPISNTRFYIHGAFCDKINADSDNHRFDKLIDNCIEKWQNIVFNHNLVEDKIKNLEKEIETLKFEKDETKKNNIVFLKEHQNLKNKMQLINNFVIENELLVADKIQLELDKNHLNEKINQYEEQNRQNNKKIDELKDSIRVLDELNDKFRNEVESFKNMGILPRIFYK